MIDSVLAELAAGLTDVGVPRGVARRALGEVRDHLEEARARVGEEEAVRAFGDPRELARLVAAEVATTATRAAAVATFGVLAVAGLAYAVLFLTLPLAGTPDVFGGSVPGLGIVAFVGIVFAPQVAFVSGCLALLRVIRTRRRGALSGAELRVQRWRAGVAVSAGLATFASLGVAAVDFRHDLAAWWVVAAVAANALLVLPLGVVAVRTARSARTRAFAGGPADDVFDDLAPVLALPFVRRLGLAIHPRRFALLVGAAAATPVALGGIADRDPFDGLVRAAAELAAVLGCYAVLGRPLGLRRDGGRTACERDEPRAEPAASERPL